MTLTLKEFLEKKEFAKEYWDKLELPTQQDVTCIFTTYNRCPFDPNSNEGKLNPLNWSTKSIIAQCPKVSEIIIVDDGSTDYTKKVVTTLREEAESKDIKFKYVKHKETRGTPIGRNTGVRHATSNFIFFMDDDCLAFKYTVYAALNTFNEMQRLGLRVGTVQLPVYYLKINPEKLTKSKNIGLLDFSKGITKSNFELFPKEYLEKIDELFLDKEKSLLRPLQIQLLVGVFICSKKVYEKVGGFPTYINWRNASSEEPEFGCRLLDNGYIMFMQPDPKAGVFHGKFGNKITTRYSVLDKNWLETKATPSLTFREITNICKIPRSNTGNRVSIEEQYYSKIIGFFVIFYKRNPLGAMEWAKNTYSNFVDKNKLNFLRKVIKTIDDKEERQKIWYSAIVDGLKLVSNIHNLGPLDFLKTLNEEIEGATISSMDLFTN